MRLLLKNLLFLLIVPGTVGAYLPLLISGHRPLVTGLPLVLGWVLLLLGFGCLAWCIWAFARYGHGTPAPPPSPEKLVVRGLYRYSRNPMYVGVLTMIAGWTVLFGDLRLAIYGALVAAGFTAMVMLYEEPRLEKRFGEEYVQYKTRVGRWFPRLRKRG